MSEIQKKKLRATFLLLIAVGIGVFFLVSTTGRAEKPKDETLSEKIAEDPDASGSFTAPAANEEMPAAPEEKPSDSMVQPPEPEPTQDGYQDPMLTLVPPKVGEDHIPDMSPIARLGKTLKEHFGSDPDYGDAKYDPQAQIDIYGGKRAIQNSRPMLEWGRELYHYGPFQPLSTWTGELNPAMPQFLLYGDWRLGTALNDDGNSQVARLVTKLTLDLDLKITATERLHATFTPLDQDNEFTRFDYGGDIRRAELILDPDPDALFFEGDLGRILEGGTGKYNHIDLPIAGGIMPLLFHNGIWMEDALTGVAATVMARNSPSQDISNMDITFFAAFDRINTPAIADENRVHVYGFNSFLETNQGYWEIGYGYTEGLREFEDNSYHSLMVSFTRRYGGWLSNSVRVLGSFGQELGPNEETAHGLLLLVENSLISHKPSTLVPYFNGFLGIDRPVPLAKTAGGLLKNTGINFDTDALTGFPKLDDTAGNTYGGVVGLEYLFDLQSQLVVEFAGLGVLGVDNDPRRTAKGTQFGPGLRYQTNIANDWLLRVNAMLGFRNHQEDLYGVGVEIRNKF